MLIHNLFSSKYVLTNLNIKLTYQHRSIYFREKNPPISESIRHKIIYVVFFILSPLVSENVQIAFHYKFIATEILKNLFAHHAPSDYVYQKDIKLKSPNHRITLFISHVYHRMYT